MRLRAWIAFLVTLVISLESVAEPNGIVVLQTDFGERDGAVATMRGVAYSVATELKVEDLTHEIPPFDVWQAAYRLWNTAPAWPAGTVFVSVVDPASESSQRLVVVRANGQYFVTPDNGTLTMIAANFDIEEVRVIDEFVHKRPGAGRSYTFYGRDILAYIGAQLAAGTLDTGSVGGRLEPTSLTMIHRPAAIQTTAGLSGFIPVLDARYGNAWTNIPKALMDDSGFNVGDALDVEVRYMDALVWQARVPYVRTFADVEEGKSLVYLNSLGNVALAVNRGNFSDDKAVGAGPDWTVRLRLPE